MPDDLPNRSPTRTTLTDTAVPAHPAEASDPIAGRYLPQRLLGRGGAKDVWLAHDLTLDRPVAVSRLREGGHDDAARERVRREARLMARLGDHPRIVTVYDAIEERGALLIVARFMAGGSLAERAAAAPERRLGTAEVLRAGEELADALDHAHANGVVHRDVKPDNVWLAADGSAALGDFGIAVALEGVPEPAGPTGTPYYVAPEQASGAAAGPPADLYALGATLYELLCGRPPFTGRRAEAVVAQHIGTPPPPPSELVPGLPPGLERLLLRLLAKAPADRPASAGEVRDALSGLRGAGAWGATPQREPLVGRERELTVAAEALRAAREGSLRVLGLSGEPGMGKTRLASEIEAAARADGALAFWGRGIEDTGAFAPWVSILRGVLPHAGDLAPAALEDVRRLTGEAGAGAEPVSSEEDRARIFDAVAALLAHVAQPAGLVVVLDDLHWADRSSLDLLRHVARAAGAARVLLVLGYRETAAEPGHPLPAVLEELARARGFEHVRLGGLALDEVRRFVPEDAGLRDTIVRDLHERTGGNPFFVAELARTLAGAQGAGASATAVPDSVREVVLHRLRPLPDSSRRALDAAAVLGRPFTVVTIARIAGLARDEARVALEPARVARLVTELPEAPGRLAFSHAIVRDAVQHELAPSRRGPLHAAVVEVLRAGAQRGAAVPVAEIAHHALVAAREGEDPQAAYELSIEAAEQAGAVLAHAEAAGHYTDALEALDELGAEAPAGARMHALEALAAATVAAGEIGTGRRHYRSVAADARRSGDAAGLARAALGFAEFHRYGEIDHEAIDVLEQALAALPPDDSALRARVAARLAVRLDPAVAGTRREALVDEAAAMARRLGDEQALSAVLWASVMVNWRPQRSAERSLSAAEMLTLAPRVKHPNELVWARMARLVDALEAGRAAAVEAELTGLAAIERESRRPYVAWCVALLRSTWATFRGCLDEGERLSEEAVVLARAGAEDTDQEYAVQRLVLAKLRWRPQDAGRAALASYAARYPDLPVWTAMLAATAWDLGREDEVRQALDGLDRDSFAWLAAGPDGLAACALLAEPVAGLGLRDAAARLYELLLPVADRNAVIDHGWAATGPFARALAPLAVALGRADDAREHFRAAAALARAWDAPAWELRVLGDRLLAGLGGTEHDALLTRALELARELELPSVAGRLVDAARAQNTTP